MIRKISSILLVSIALFLFCGSLAAQDKGSVQAWHASDLWPDHLMEVFKENYFVTGLPLNTHPDYDTNDLVYQASMKFNIINIPGNWHMFWGYTQLAVWDVYKPSNPFRGNTYTDGLYFWHPDMPGTSGLWSRMDLLCGYEHRSNGYDSSASRSLDYLFVTGTWNASSWFSAQLTARFGMGSIGNDFSLEMFNRYEGYVNCAIGLHTPDRRFMASLSVTPLFAGDIPANISAELAWNPVPHVDWLYLTARYHYGYDEDQNDCANPDVFLKHMLRFGLSVQPRSMGHKLFW